MMGSFLQYWWWESREEVRCCRLVTWSAGSGPGTDPDEGQMVTDSELEPGQKNVDNFEIDRECDELKYMLEGTKNKAGLHTSMLMTLSGD